MALVLAKAIVLALEKLRRQLLGLGARRRSAHDRPRTRVHIVRMLLFTRLVTVFLASFLVSSRARANGIRPAKQQDGKDGDLDDGESLHGG
jgi:hypothetical protein